MNELAVQGANDTNQDVDRNAINQELNALTDEIDRISETTQFNKQFLLDGTFTNKKLQVGANGGQNIGINIQKMDAKTLGLKDIEYAQGISALAYNTISFKGVDYTYDTTKSPDDNKKLFASMCMHAGQAAFTAEMVTLNSEGLFTYDGTDGKETKDQAISAGRKALGEKYWGSADGRWDTLLASAKISGLKTAGGFGQVSTLARADVGDYTKANATLMAVQGAINIVSTQRSSLGALQNRLEHTVSNLDNVSENTQAAESRIRDTDMAAQMVEYSKNNILAQAGQSMLAQGNQSTQGVLSLLQ
jgi:flagellin